MSEKKTISRYHQQEKKSERRISIFFTYDILLSINDENVPPNVVLVKS
jgi:hypothetical protein